QSRAFCASETSAAAGLLVVAGVVLFDDVLRGASPARFSPSSRRRRSPLPRSPSDPRPSRLNRRRRSRRSSSDEPLPLSPPFAAAGPVPNPDGPGGSCASATAAAVIDAATNTPTTRKENCLITRLNPVTNPRCRKHYQRHFTPNPDPLGGTIPVDENE